MENIRNRGVGALIALIVLVVVIVLFVIGQLSPTEAALFGALALSRLL